jgi:murein DD-endopeptidase MepM/ murein hydrolase activator NlpD
MSIRLYRPVPINFKISSPFGFREDPFKKKQGRHHNGIDFAVPVGTGVTAMATGPVVRSGWENEADKKQGYGLRITQEIDVNGIIYYVTYAHLSQIWAEAGKLIMAGKALGLSGNTGSSTGPHLHVDARIRDTKEYSDIQFVEFGEVA